jgi:hypothetical protein
MKSPFGKMGKLGGVREIMAKAGLRAVASYIIISLLLFSSFYFFIMKISQNNNETASIIGSFWFCFSCSTASLIFAASQTPSAAYPALMACGLTLTASSIICSCTSSFAGGF